MKTIHDEPAFSSLQIANWILAVAKKKKTPLTMMQLQKLIYFAHGWWLTFTGAPLTSDLPETWKYGPVYPPVYREFRRFGTHPVTNQAKIEDNSKLSDSVDELLGWVVASYGKNHALVLSQITHEDDSPWDQVRKAKGFYAPIPHNVIKDYFDSERDGQKERHFP